MVFVLNRHNSDRISPRPDSRACARAYVEANAVVPVGAPDGPRVPSEGTQPQKPKRDRSHPYDLKPRPKQFGRHSKPRPPNTSKAIAAAFLLSEEFRQAEA